MAKESIFPTAPGGDPGKKKKQGRRAWVAGFVFAPLILLFAMVNIPQAPEIGATLLSIVAALGGGVIGFGCLFMLSVTLPTLLLQLFNIKQSAKTGKALLLSFGKALLYAGATFVFGFFIAPLFMPALFGLIVPALPFLSVFEGVVTGSSLSGLLMTIASSLITLLKTLWKSPVKNMVMQNPGRAFEVLVAGLLIGGAAFLMIAAVVGLIQIAFPVVLIVGGILASVSTLAAFGFFTDWAPTVMNMFNKIGSSKPEFDMSSLGSSPPTPAPSPYNFAPRGQPTPQQPTLGESTFPPRPTGMVDASSALSSSGPSSPSAN